MWIRRVLKELGVEEKGPVKTWCDNKAIIGIAQNPILHDLTKHIVMVSLVFVYLVLYFNLFVSFIYCLVFGFQIRINFIICFVYIYS